MESKVSAVLFASDTRRVADFYSGALGLVTIAEDSDHSVLNCRGFDLIVHRIPDDRRDQDGSGPRSSGAIRLDFPVDDLAESRRRAKALGGQIDDTPPAWAGPDAAIFLGRDPEGNVFKVSQSGA